jgi:hypothetical protein
MTAKYRVYQKGCIFYSQQWDVQGDTWVTLYESLDPSTCIEYVEAKRYRDSLVGFEAVVKEWL